MVKLDELLAKKADKKKSPMKVKEVVGIDPSTHSLAFAIAKRDEESKLSIGYRGKINFKGDPEAEQFKKISAFVGMLEDKDKDLECVIEQTIYIQNAQTSRKMAYVVGYTWGRMIQANIPVTDIGPMVWKGWLGYKKVTKQQKQAWADEGMSKTEVKKKAAFERKHRTRLILEEKGFHTEDDDVMDAIGIALWGACNL